jgi:diguanylate cyclase (GGDEF)-like protein
MAEAAAMGTRRSSARVIAGIPVVIALVLAGAGIALTAGLIDRYGAGLGPSAELLVLALLQAANYRMSGWLSARFRTPVWQTDVAILAAGLVLLEPLGVVLAMVVGVFVGCLLDRRSAAGLVLMTTNTLLMASAVTAMVFALADGAERTSARYGVVACLGVLAGQVLWELAISAWFRAAFDEPFWSGLKAALRFGLPRAPFIAGVGYSAGIAATVVPVAGLFMVPALTGIVFVLAEHFKAERDRERAETLFRTAEAAHASIDPADVDDALIAAASSLLKADAELRPTAPVEGELGVPLDVAEERWLIVSGDAAAEDAEQLLAAVAAVGSSALENARMAEELRHRAVHDATTGLPNQLLFSDRVAQAVGSAGRKGERFVVIAVDLDAFRKVNDSLGHAAGDWLLREVGQRMGQVIRAGDTVARLSGDTFMLLLPGVGTAESAGVLTEKLLAAISRPFELDGQDIFMSACAGLAFYPDDGVEAGHLLRNADSALHRAKAHGTGTYQIYAHGMNELAHQRLARESELHQAVRRDELRVCYQPQVDLRTGRIAGLEALVRWEHPTLGLLAPVEFVPLAEESGLIVEVDTWVLRQACRQAAAWLDAGLPPVRVGVNLSARHFQSPERFIGTIRDAVSDSGLPSMLLELEVTEGLAVTEDESALVLQRIRDLGVSISIDDFGTGYSMLGRLSRFPVDRLKIDRSFVKEIRSARDDAPIVSAIIAMARSLRIETVAEGVETVEQQQFLRNRGCDIAQGFLFSHPAGPEEVEQMLRAPSGFDVTSPVR